MEYEELVQWRNICEYMNSQKYKLAEPADLIRKFGTEILPLVAPDRTRRQKLWDEHKIQLIKWDHDEESWQLKGNWEDKIWYLEQLVLFGRSPEELPKRWLEKWDAKQQAKLQKEKEQEFWKPFDRVIYDLDSIKYYYLDSCFMTPGAGLEHLTRLVSSITSSLTKAKLQLKELRQPAPGSVVLGSGLGPEPGSAVLGNMDLDLDVENDL